MKNFRRFAFIGAAFLAFWGFSSAQAHADTVIPDIVLSNQAGTEAPGVSASMALLGCGLTGTATSAVNITDSAGVYFRLSGTAGARIQWSMGNAVWSNGILLTPGQNGFVNKWGTQIRFVFQGSGYGCVSYMLGKGAGSSGSPTWITGTVTANQGTAAVLPWPVIPTDVDGTPLAQSAMSASGGGGATVPNTRSLINFLDSDGTVVPVSPSASRRLPTNSIVVASDGSTPRYTTYTAGSSPLGYDQAAPSFGFAVDTTPTGGALIFRPAQCKNIITASLMMAATTYTSGTFATGYLFMTPSASTRFTVTNPLSNTQTAYVYPSFSATANYSATPVTLTPGTSISFDPGEAPTYLHAAWATGVQGASGLVFYGCYGNPYTGTTYGFFKGLWDSLKEVLTARVDGLLDLVSTPAQAANVTYTGPMQCLQWLASSSFTIANNTNEQTVFEIAGVPNNMTIMSFRVDMTAATTLTGCQFRIYTKRGAGSYVLLSDLEHPTGINLWLLTGIDGYECMWKSVSIAYGDSFKVTAQQTVASASFAIPYDVVALR